MKSKVMDAVAKKAEGYNCAQAVFCTYCEEFGMSQQEGYRLSEALGSGIAGLQEVCGSLNALTMLIGLSNSDGILASKATRPATYQKTKEAAALFQAQCAHLRCHDILQESDEQGKRIVPCDQCVKAAAEIAERLLFQEA